MTSLRSTRLRCMHSHDVISSSMCRAINGRGWIQPHPHYVRILGDSPHQNTSSAVHLRTKEEEWLSLLLLCMQVSATLCYRARIWGSSAPAVLNLQALAGLLLCFIHKISKPLPLHIIIIKIFLSSLLPATPGAGCHNESTSRELKALCRRTCKEVYIYNCLIIGDQVSDSMITPFNISRLRCWKL